MVLPCLLKKLFNLRLSEQKSSYASSQIILPLTTHSLNMLPIEMRSHSYEMLRIIESLESLLKNILSAIRASCDLFKIRLPGRNEEPNMNNERNADTLSLSLVSQLEAWLGIYYRLYLLTSELLPLLEFDVQYSHADTVDDCLLSP